MICWFWVRYIKFWAESKLCFGSKNLFSPKKTFWTKNKRELVPRGLNDDHKDSLQESDSFVNKLCFNYPIKRGLDVFNHLNKILNYLTWSGPAFWCYQKNIDKSALENDWFFHSKINPMEALMSTAIVFCRKIDSFFSLKLYKWIN